MVKTLYFKAMILHNDLRKENIMIHIENGRGKLYIIDYGEADHTTLLSKEDLYQKTINAHITFGNKIIPLDLLFKK